MNKKSYFLVLIVAIMSFSMVSCNKEKSDWKNAGQLNTIESYEKYLANYAQGRYGEEAKKRLEDLEWAKISIENTIESYSNYLAKYPKTQYTENAQKQIEELEWNKAEMQNSFGTYEKYITKYPQGRFSNEAKQRVKELEKLEEAGIVPFEAGYCRVEGPLFFVAKAGAEFMFGPVIKFKGKEFQIAQPMSKDSYAVPAINVQFLNKDKKPEGMPIEFKSIDQEWNPSLNTLDITFSNQNIKVILRVYPLASGFIRRNIECTRQK